MSPVEHYKKCSQKLGQTSSQVRQFKHSKNLLSRWIKGSNDASSQPPSQGGTSDPVVVNNEDLFELQDLDLSLT